MQQQHNQCYPLCPRTTPGSVSRIEEPERRWNQGVIGHTYYSVKQRTSCFMRTQVLQAGAGSCSQHDVKCLRGLQDARDVVNRGEGRILTLSIVIGREHGGEIGASISYSRESR